jgi:branched-chain amino acid transport system substrate-binding protein
VKAYKARYNNEDPSYESAGGYAAGLILQHAIEQAGTLDTAKVAEKLNATDATTFYGRTKFATAGNEHGLQVGHSIVLSQWHKDKGGKLVKDVVWPQAVKSAPLAYPLR